MPRKLALKRLSQSDLAIFQHYFDNNDVSGQKCINLNKNVFKNQLYPHLPDYDEMEVQLNVMGPGLSTQQHRLVRKIKRSAGSKNWRLNGKTIPNPSSGDVDRYKILANKDIAVFEFFDGADGKANAVRMVLLSNAIPDDRQASAALDLLIPLSNMTVVSAEVLGAAIVETVSDGHPLQTFLAFDDDLELLVEGVEAEISPEADTPEVGQHPRAPGAVRAPRVKIFKPVDYTKAAKPSQQRVSKETIQKVRAAQSRTGEVGEELVNLFLKGKEGTYEWTSSLYPFSTFDFHRTDITDGEYIDVKSTSKGFDEPFHLSTGELRQAAYASGPYHIFRVYEAQGLPKMRISEPINGLAKRVIAQLQGWQDAIQGVEPDGLLLIPSLLGDGLGFGDEITLVFDEE